MPELPEVETVRRGLAPAMEGHTIARLELRRADLRFPFPADLSTAAQGRRVVSLGRRAKFMTIDLDDGAVIVCHLGMSGSFRVEGPDLSDQPGDFHHSRNKDQRHDHVTFHMAGRDGEPSARIIYNDPRRFGYIQYVQRVDFDTHPSFALLGPEPMGNALSADYLAARFVNRKTPIKAALLDQRNIAGLGNIYVCEALWRSGISPKRLAGSLVTKAGTPGMALKRLVPAIIDVIAEAIEAGGSTLRDHAQADGTLGYFQHRFAAYDREGEACSQPGCNGTIKRIVQSGRSTFYCPVHQR
ncbi:MAG: bifunctional DNA-formamidopyrimidine glycosylase/DNA-(apurinic or apyrimidinic site) lyase [Pseudomonadota bacterium]